MLRKDVFSEKNILDCTPYCCKTLDYQGKTTISSVLCILSNIIYDMWKTTIDFVKTWCYDEVAERKRNQNPFRS